MLKILSTLTILLFSINTYAAAKYVGIWCQKFDDFNQYLIIDSKGNVESMAVGKVETIMQQKGYVSQGASEFHIVLDKMDIGVVDYRKNILGQLVLLFDNGGIQRYSKCADPRK